MPTPEPASPAPQQIKFHHIKGNFFRAIHADGAWISVHPNEFIHLTFYNERAPIPTEVINNLSEDGLLAEETTRVAKKGFVREMEVDVILNRKTALALHKWLDEYINDALPKGDVDMI